MSGSNGSSVVAPSNAVATRPQVAIDPVAIRGKLRNTMSKSEAMKVLFEHMAEVLPRGLFHDVPRSNHQPAGDAIGWRKSSSIVALDPAIPVDTSAAVLGIWCILSFSARQMGAIALQIGIVMPQGVRSKMLTEAVADVSQYIQRPEVIKQGTAATSTVAGTAVGTSDGTANFAVSLALCAELGVPATHWLDYAAYGLAWIHKHGVDMTRLPGTNFSAADLARIAGLYCDAYKRFPAFYQDIPRDQVVPFQSTHLFPGTWDAFSLTMAFAHKLKNGANALVEPPRFVPVNITTRAAPAASQLFTLTGVITQVGPTLTQSQMCDNFNAAVKRCVDGAGELVFTAGNRLVIMPKAKLGSLQASNLLKANRS